MEKYGIPIICRQFLVGPWDSRHEVAKSNFVTLVVFVKLNVDLNIGLY